MENESIKISVMIPAFNEERTIQAVIESHQKILEKLQHRISDWEIVCLDDASQDGTPRILKEMAQKIDGLKS